MKSFLRMTLDECVQFSSNLWYMASALCTCISASITKRLLVIYSRLNFLIHYSRAVHPPFFCVSFRNNKIPAKKMPEDEGSTCLRRETEELEKKSILLGKIFPHQKHAWLGIHSFPNLIHKHKFNNIMWTCEGSHGSSVCKIRMHPYFLLWCIGMCCSSGATYPHVLSMRAEGRWTFSEWIIKNWNVINARICLILLSLIFEQLNVFLESRQGTRKDALYEW